MKTLSINEYSSNGLVASTIPHILMDELESCYGIVIQINNGMAIVIPGMTTTDGCLCLKKWRSTSKKYRTITKYKGHPTKNDTIRWVLGQFHQHIEGDTTVDWPVVIQVLNAHDDYSAAYWFKTK